MRSLQPVSQIIPVRKLCRTIPTWALLTALVWVPHIAAQTTDGQAADNKDATAQKAKDKPPEKIDWGEWDSAQMPKQAYGVGIEGKIEAEISKLDQSNLLDNADGVAAKSKGANPNELLPPKVKNLKKMMEELEAMESKVKQEIDDESEF